jgi:hypothetical protein
MKCPTPLSLVVTALAAGTAVAQAPPARTGEPHPPLRLPTIDGDRTIDLRELAGSKVLLIEFASW